jgi:hypothetical protein
MRMRRITLFAAAPVAVTGMLLAGCASSASPDTGSQAHSAAPLVVAKAPLKCTASVTRRHPRDYTTVGVRVRTAPHARIAAVATFRLSTTTHRHRASGNGMHTFWYHLGAVKPRFQVVVHVTTHRHGRTGSCETWFSPPKPPPAPAPVPPSSPPAPAPAPTATPAPSAASCYPISDEGTCYEPGEFCRDSDHGASGVAGDGEKIVCEDNDGWRWEPA